MSEILRSRQYGKNKMAVSLRKIGTDQFDVYVYKDESVTNMVCFWGESARTIATNMYYQFMNDLERDEHCQLTTCSECGMAVNLERFGLSPRCESCSI